MKGLLSGGVELPGDRSNASGLGGCECSSFPSTTHPALEPGLCVEWLVGSRQRDPCCESKGLELWILFLIGPVLGSYLFRVEVWARGGRPSLHQPGQISDFADARGGPVNVVIFIRTLYMRYFLSSLLAMPTSSINRLKCCSCFSLLLHLYSLKSEAVP